MKHLLLSCLLGALLAPTLVAIQTQSMTDEGYANFYRGELKNLALSNLGELEAAPLLQEVTRLDHPVVWAAVPDGKGNLILGTGNRGAVLRLAPDGTTETLFAPDVVLTRALAVAPDGSIFVGSSPKSAIFRIPPDGGKPQVFLNLPDVYLWTFVLEGQDLWITTGMEARLLRVPLSDDFQSAGEVEEWFKSKDDHFTALIRDGKRWIVGASRKGAIYAVEEKGKGYALAQVGDDEVRTLAVGSDGLIYFTTFSSGSGSSSSSTGSGSGTGASSPNDLPPLVVNAPGGSDNKGSSYLYRLEKSGFTTALWRSSRLGLFSLVPISDRYWLAGTNDGGKVFYFADRDDWGLQHQLPRGGEVSVIVPAPDDSGTFLIISSNPGVVYRLGGASKEPGVFLSRTLDARQPARWGALHFTLSRPGEHSVSTRVGNTEEPDVTWSEWSPLTDGVATSPVGRYLQYRVELPGDSSARFLRARLFYQMPNAAPVVTAIRLLNFGTELQVVNNQPSVLDFAAAFRDADVSRFEGTSEDRLKLMRRPDQTLRTIVWRASDPNQDRLTYDLFLRAADQAQWTTLARDLTDPVHVLNAAGLTPGLYQVKVVASDHRSNPPEDALTGTRVSELFLLDSTPPEIRLETQDAGAREWTFSVRSDAAALVAAQIAFDGGKPRELRPVDGLFDQLTETFTVTLPADLSPGATVVFEALDEVGNQAMWTGSVD